MIRRNTRLALAAVMLAACSHPERSPPISSGPAPAADASEVSIYAAVLQVAWDSVLRPAGPRAAGIKVAVWDSSVSHPLRAERFALPPDVLLDFERRGLADAHCPSLAPGACLSSRPLWWVVLISISCSEPDSCESGFQEQVIRGASSLTLDGSAWRVVLKRCSGRWVVVRAFRMLSS